MSRILERTSDYKLAVSVLGVAHLPQLKPSQPHQSMNMPSIALVGLPMGNGSRP